MMLIEGRDADVLKRLLAAAANLGSLEVRGRAACSKQRENVKFQLRLDPVCPKRHVKENLNPDCMLLAISRFARCHDRLDGRHRRY